MEESNVLELAGDGWQRTLAPHDEVRFGRGGGGVEIALADDPRLHRHCGTVRVDDEGWYLANTGRWLRLRVVGRDRFGVDSLEPGQSLLVPWPSARVQVFAGDRCFEFDARLVGERTEALPAPAAADDDATHVPIRVDRSAAYFRALVALCEPRLLDPSSPLVATDLEIARRLNRSGTEAARVTGKTVERRLDNCRIRFGLKVTDEIGLSVGLERRDSRRVLADLALLTATVTADDLAVLGLATDDVRAG